MENKNSIVLFSTVFLIIGIFVGWLICSNNQSKNTSSNTHVIQNGKMMDNAVSGMMADLEGKTGDAFDKAFLEEMVIHHEGAVEMAKLVLSTSKRPELIKVANEIISAQTKEIEMMNAWNKNWFKE